MKMIIILMIMVSLLGFGCRSANECDLSESFSPTASKFVVDQGFERYNFRVDFSQKVEVYRGDCADEKNINYTTMQITSFAPCEQTVNYVIDINLGSDSYQLSDNGIVIKPDETIDFGIVREGGQRIDFAQIDVALFCPLCPADMP